MTPEACYALLTTTELISHVGGWQWDARTNAVLWSDETARIFGRDPGSYKPTFTDFIGAIHTADRSSVEEAIRAYVSAASDGYDVEFRILLPSHPERTIHALGERIVDDTGKVVGIAGTCQDVTDGRLAEAGRVAAQRKPQPGSQK